MAGSVGSNDGDMGFQIAPMVDVVFVLLLFFMAAAGSQMVEKEIEIQFPTSPKFADVTPNLPIVIEIAPDGAVRANDLELGVGGDRNLPSLRE